MRSIIVGTAGHIDHGKSALVTALTGTDPDRLKEEKERGITIELGFAHLDLGGGLTASFIDVPGHERFVRHMLAGAHGLDAVVLVVAADESVMPQTREHFQICRLLGVSRGLVALTKCDAADPELQALAELEVKELVAGSFLEGAPVLRVSARTGEGLPGLVDALRRLAAEVPEREARGLLRLPIDRAFTLRGFGTVVTGTLRGGRLRSGDEVFVQPAGRRARVRGLHVHGHPVEEVTAGHRVAVNLAGVEVQQLQRGDVVGAPGELEPTSVVDVELSLLPGERPLADQTRVRVHAGTAEVMGRVRLLGAAAVAPGGHAFAQLRLEKPVVAGRDDRLVLRSYSPAVTIGGAVVLDPLAAKRRAGPRASDEHAAALAGVDVPVAAARMIAAAGERGVRLGALGTRLTTPAAALPDLLRGVPGVVALGEWYVAESALVELGRRIVEALRAHHATHPLRREMPREELRTRVFARCPPGTMEHVIERLAARGELRVSAEGAALAGHEVRLSGEEERARDVLLEAAAAAGLTGIDVSVVARDSRQPPPVLERVVRVLLSEGQLCRVGDLVVHRGALDALKQDVRTRFGAGGRLDVGALKEMTGLSRKFVIPLLEFLDRERVTRRAGPDRLVLAG